MSLYHYTSVQSGRKHTCNAMGYLDVQKQLMGIGTIDKMMH